MWVRMETLENRENGLAANHGHCIVRHMYGGGNQEPGNPALMMDALQLPGAGVRRLAYSISRGVERPPLSPPPPAEYAQTASWGFLLWKMQDYPSPVWRFQSLIAGPVVWSWFDDVWR